MLRYVFFVALELGLGREPLLGEVVGRCRVAHRLVGEQRADVLAQAKADQHNAVD